MHNEVHYFHFDEEIIATMEERYPGSGAHLRAIREIALAQPLTAEQEAFAEKVRRFHDATREGDRERRRLGEWYLETGALAISLHFREWRRSRGTDE